MTHPEGNSVRELIEEARQLRRGQQPSAALFEATLERLAREERALGSSPARQLSGRGSLMHGWKGAARWLLRPGLPRLAPAFVLALAIVVSWRALRPGAREEPASPPVAIAAEPALAAEEQAGGSAGSATARAATPAPIRAATPAPAAVVAPSPQPTGGTPRTGAANAPVRPRSANCERPFWVDANGIKRLKMDCLAASPACEPPWLSDPNGVLRMKPGCSSPAQTKESPAEKAAPRAKEKKARTQAAGAGL